MDYQSMLQLAQEHKFTSFTKLQESAFSNPATYEADKDLFIIGETSSGKTLIPLLLYCAAVKEAAIRGDEYPKMLFVVPYRALAAQKLKEFTQFFDGWGLKIIQSTGEFRQDDDAVQKGQVHVAVVITEKVYKYEARDSSFLSKYDYLVLDEIGLVNSADRGVRLDFIFAWAHSQKAYGGRPRTIALGTPFYDWSAYISSYGFHPIRTEDRPVKLNEVSLTFNEYGITDVEGPCDFLHPMRMLTTKDMANLTRHYEVPMTRCHLLDQYCPIREPARSDPSLLCPIAKKPCRWPVEFLPEGQNRGSQYILLKICREHLLAGHQILIFVNDREKVKQYCSLLYRQLKDLLPEAPPAEECRREILSRCGLEGEDVFGILEYEDGSSVELEFYRSFMSGVGFHSAALPNELRTYVEDKLLGSREMRIVCSTETLAFGVNSSVDVVIVADLYKHEGGDIRALTLNEYQNYAGRSGRLRRDLNVTDAKGYVYTLIGSKRTDCWEELKRSAATPQRLYSRFHADNGQKISFFLMNLLPTDTDDSMSVDQLVESVASLPQDGSYTPEVMRGKVRAALKFLLQEGLAARMRAGGPRGRRSTAPEERYCLTGLGKRLRGYILHSDDYRQLLKALEEYVNGVFLESDKTTFLFRLLQTKHAESGLTSIFSGSETRRELDDLRNYIQLHTKGVNHTLDWLYACRDDRTLSILAAMIAWSDGESAKTLYRQFGVHYALLAKLAEQVAYLIEIAAEILPFRMAQVWQEKQDVYQRMKVSIDDFQAQVDSKVSDIRNLFSSIYFGVNTDISTELLDYLDPADLAPEEKEEDAVALAQELSLKRINPQTARMLRRIAVRYLFFDNPPEVDWTNLSARNNFLNQRWQYQKDIDGMGPHIAGFFRSVFGDEIADQKVEVKV